VSRVERAGPLPGVEVWGLGERLHVACECRPYLSAVAICPGTCSFVLGLRAPPRTVVVPRAGAERCAGLAEGAVGRHRSRHNFTSYTEWVTLELLGNGQRAGSPERVQEP
jgi:hypothetical protein